MKLSWRRKEDAPVEQDTGEQMHKNMEIIKKAQERVLEGFALPQRDELRLTDEELKAAFRKANRFSGPVQKSFMILSPPPKFEEMLTSFIAQDIACKVEKVQTPIELSEEGRRQVSELSNKLSEGLKGIVNVKEKEFRIDGELLGDPIRYGAGSILRWSSRTYAVSSHPSDDVRRFRVYWTSDDKSYFKGRESHYTPEGRLMYLSDSHKTKVYLKPSEKLLFDLGEDVVNGLVALGMISKGKNTLDVGELQKIHEKMADNKTKKVKLNELSKMPHISEDVTSAYHFIESTYEILKDIQKAKRFEPVISELASSYEAKSDLKEYEEKKNRDKVTHSWN